MEILQTTKMTSPGTNTSSMINYTIIHPGDNTHIDEFLESIETEKITEEDNRNLTKPITLNELTMTLRSSSRTTPGPDSIGNQVYKICWDLVGKHILEAWNYSLLTGCLSESQRSLMICLLEKKGKDRRLINNLRPITLSNCDLKLITKTYIVVHALLPPFRATIYFTLQAQSRFK